MSSFNQDVQVFDLRYAVLLRRWLALPVEPLRITGAVAFLLTMFFAAALWLPTAGFFWVLEAKGSLSALAQTLALWLIAVLLLPVLALVFDCFTRLWRDGSIVAITLVVLASGMVLSMRNSSATGHDSHDAVTIALLIIASVGVLQLLSIMVALAVPTLRFAVWLPRTSSLKPFLKFRLDLEGGQSFLRMLVDVSRTMLLISLRASVIAVPVTLITAPMRLFGGVVGALLNNVIVLLALALARKPFIRLINDALVRHRANLFARAPDVIGRDSRPPVLYLRAFRDDWLTIPSWSNWFGRILGANVEAIGFENTVCRIAYGFGPVVALARPDARSIGADAGGAARELPIGDRWRELVTARLYEASLVVLVHGRGEGLRWEIATITSNDLLDKTVFMFPPSRKSAIGSFAFDSLIGQDTFVGGKNLQFDQSSSHPNAKPILAATYDESTGRFIACTSKSASSLGYELALRLCLSMQGVTSSRSHDAAAGVKSVTAFRSR